MVIIIIARNVSTFVYIHLVHNEFIIVFVYLIIDRSTRCYNDHHVVLLTKAFEACNIKSLFCGEGDINKLCLVAQSADTGPASADTDPTVGWY